MQSHEFKMGFNLCKTFLQFLRWCHARFIECQYNRWVYGINIKYRFWYQRTYMTGGKILRPIWHWCFMRITRWEDFVYPSDDVSLSHSNSTTLILGQFYLGSKILGLELRDVTIKSSIWKMKCSELINDLNLFIFIKFWLWKWHWKSQVILERYS